MGSLRDRYFNKPKKEVQVIANDPIIEDAKLDTRRINEPEKRSIAEKIEETKAVLSDPIGASTVNASDEIKQRNLDRVQEDLDVTSNGLLEGKNDPKVKRKMLEWINKTVKKYKGE